MSGCHNPYENVNHQQHVDQMIKENTKHQIEEAIANLNINQWYIHGFESGFSAGFQMAINMKNDGTI